VGIYEAFYFFGLLLLLRTKKECTLCMRGEAWKMALLNIWCLLGTPFAMHRLVSAYRHSLPGSPLSGLDRANKLAGKHRVDAAIQEYTRLAEKLRYRAMIWYNAGRTLLADRRLPEAARYLNLALEQCSNHLPSQQALKECGRPPTGH
jgi:tetratricopeptide (TPR) repeat protein